MFAHHSSASNTSWQAVKKGFDDACEKIGANCQMVFTQTAGAVEQQLSNIEAVLAREPDALLTTIVDDKAPDDVIARASTAGTFVIGVNVDDSEGAKGNRRAHLLGRGSARPAIRLGKQCPKLGLTFRPIDEKVRDTLHWYRQEGRA